MRSQVGMMLGYLDGYSPCLTFDDSIPQNFHDIRSFGPAEIIVIPHTADDGKDYNQTKASFLLLSPFFRSWRARATF